MSALPRTLAHRRFTARTVSALVGCLVLAVIAACAHHEIRAPDTHRPESAEPTPEPAAVARYSRYTVVEMSPDAAQVDLMQQVVDIHVPATESSSVGDTVRYLLLHSGYRLCDDPVVGDLDGFLLPAAHVHMGPLPLGSALQLLVGRAWELRVDEGNRRVCFGRVDASRAADSAIPVAADPQIATAVGRQK